MSKLTPCCLSICYDNCLYFFESTGVIGTSASFVCTWPGRPLRHSWIAQSSFRVKAIMLNGQGTFGLARQVDRSGADSAYLGTVRYLNCIIRTKFEERSKLRWQLSEIDAILPVVQECFGGWGPWYVFVLILAISHVFTSFVRLTHLEITSTNLAEEVCSRVTSKLWNTL